MVDKVAIQTIPNIHMNHSVFNRSFNRKFTMSPNMLVPFFVDSILPDDIMRLKSSMFIRFNNLICPIMDDLIVDAYFFYCRNRDVYNPATRVMGAKEINDKKEYRMPYITNQCIPSYEQTVSGKTDKVYNAWQTSESEGISNYNDYIAKRFTFEQNGLEFKIPFSYDTNETMITSAIDNKAGVGTVSCAWQVGGIGEYLYGVVGDGVKALNALRAMMYYKIWDTWFRNEQYSEPCCATDKDVDKMITEDLPTTKNAKVYAINAITKPFQYMTDIKQDETASRFVNNWSYEQAELSRFMCGGNATIGTTTTTSIYMNKNYMKDIGYRNNGVMPVSKKSDYFTLALPNPTLEEVQMPISFDNLSIETNLAADGALALTRQSGGAFTSFGELQIQGSNETTYLSSVNNTGRFNYKSGIKATSELSGESAVGTIDDLRKAFQLDLFWRRENIAGTRYPEIIKAHFNTIIPDDQLGIPQLIGMGHGSFNIIPVVQTSESTSNNALGTLAANGVCRLNISIGQKHFKEHGYIIGVMCIRSYNTYQEQYDRDAFRFERFDYYWPEFRRLGDQAIYGYEVFNPTQNFKRFKNDYNNKWSEQPVFKNRSDYLNATFNQTDLANGKITYNTSTSKDTLGNAQKEAFEAWGYQERYAEYRYKNNEIAGQFRSRADYIPTASIDIGGSVSESSKANIRGTLDWWTLSYDWDNENKRTIYGGGEMLGMIPKLNADFMKAETPWKRIAVDRNQHQFYVDCYNAYKCCRPLQAVVIPGMADHL